MHPRAWMSMLVLGLVVALGACEQMRANERPPMNPFFSPSPQGGNRP